MADIVEKLLVAANDKERLDSALLKEAADEISRLRNEYTRAKGKLEQNQKFGEPEF